MGVLTWKQDCFCVLAITLNRVRRFLQAGTDLLISGSDGGRREIPFGEKKDSPDFFDLCYGSRGPQQTKRNKSQGEPFCSAVSELLLALLFH